MLVIPARAMSNAPHSEFPAKIAQVTGLGAKLAQRAVEAGICTLEDLEMAAHDGRLARVPGFGPRRVAQVRERLDRHLSRPTRHKPLAERPSVETLLVLDAEYRLLAERNELPTIAPHRFNPDHRKWLPIWHVERDGWTFTVMFSNTALAFANNKRRDWVIIVYERDGKDDHCTVVTEHSGPLRGRRVVRGRERECRPAYLRRKVSPEVRAWVHDLAEHLPGKPIGPSGSRSPYVKKAAPARHEPEPCQLGQMALPWG